MVYKLLISEDNFYKNNPQEYVIYYNENNISKVFNLKKNKFDKYNFYHIISNKLHTINKKLNEEELYDELNNMKYKFKNYKNITIYNYKLLDLLLNSNYSVRKLGIIKLKNIITDAR